MLCAFEHLCKQGNTKPNTLSYCLACFRILVAFVTLSRWMPVAEQRQAVHEPRSSCSCVSLPRSDGVQRAEVVLQSKECTIDKRRRCRAWKVAAAQASASWTAPTVNSTKDKHTRLPRPPGPLLASCERECRAAASRARARSYVSLRFSQLHTTGAGVEGDGCFANAASPMCAMMAGTPVSGCRHTTGYAAPTPLRCHPCFASAPDQGTH